MANDVENSIGPIVSALRRNRVFCAKINLACAGNVEDEKSRRCSLQYTDQRRPKKENKKKRGFKETSMKIEIRNSRIIRFKDTRDRKDKKKKENQDYKAVGE